MHTKYINYFDSRYFEVFKSHKKVKISTSDLIYMIYAVQMRYEWYRCGTGAQDAVRAARDAVRAAQRLYKPPRCSYSGTWHGSDAV